nr:hypothetical protein [Belliella aquatica]
MLVFYVFFNAGLSYSMHFCGDDFKRINVLTDYKSCCESSIPMPDCCGDVSSLELPNTDQQISDVYNLQAIGIDLLVSDFQYELLPFDFKLSEIIAFADSSPPILQNTPIYIFYQVFLI